VNGLLDRRGIPPNALAKSIAAPRIPSAASEIGVALDLIAKHEQAPGFGNK
jgi:hypothetical protein